MTERTLCTLWPSLVSINWHYTYNLGHWNKEWLRKTDSSLWEWYSNIDYCIQRCKCSLLNMHVHIQTLTEVHSRAQKHYYISHTRFLAPKLLSNNSRSCAAWCVYFVVLCLCKDRTGRDKGSPVGVFTANTAEENSFRRRRGRGLMAGA